MQTKENERLLDKAAVAELLGVSQFTIDQWVSQKKIPFMKLCGKLVRFKREVILKWADDMQVSPE